MKLQIPRIGNSLGVIVPKATLEAWGVREGGHLELTERGIRPPAIPVASHQTLDEHKRKLAAAVVALLGRDERSNRLRQSPPYVGLLARDEVRRLNEEAAG